MYITIEQTKKHLNIDSGYNEDNQYISDLINVTEITVEKHINQSLNDIANANGGVLPSPLQHAMLLLIGNYYAMRESISFNGKSIEIPLSYSYLLDFYRNYSN